MCLSDVFVSVLTVASKRLAICFVWHFIFPLVATLTNEDTYRECLIEDNNATEVAFKHITQSCSHVKVWR